MENLKEMGTFSLLLLREEIDCELEKRKEERKRRCEEMKRCQEAQEKLANAITEYLNAGFDGVFITGDGSDEREMDVADIHTILSKEYDIGVSF